MKLSLCTEVQLFFIKFFEERFFMQINIELREFLCFIRNLIQKLWF